MLVLSRQLNQSVMIGDIISVTVTEIRGNQIKLGFEAPRDMPIHRREVWEAIQGEVERHNRQQAATAGDSNVAGLATDVVVAGLLTEPLAAEVLTEEASADWLNQLSVPPLVTTRPVTDGTSEEQAA